MIADAAALFRRFFRAGAPSPAARPARDRVCGNCKHFRNDPADMEAALPGFTALSSGYASVRGDDGLCLRHDRFVAVASTCPQFAPARAR